MQLHMYCLVGWVGLLADTRVYMHIIRAYINRKFKKKKKSTTLQKASEREKENEFYDQEFATPHQTKPFAHSLSQILLLYYFVQLIHSIQHM